MLHQYVAELVANRRLRKFPSRSGYDLLVPRRFSQSLESCNGSARASIRKLGFALLVPTSSESDHAAELFFDEPFIPQLRDCLTNPRGVEGLLGQGHELTWILFIAEGEGDEEPAPDGLPIHDTMLCTRAGAGNGPSVPVFGYLCSFF